MKKKIISSLIIGVAVLAVVLLLQNRLYKFFDSINRGYSSLLFNLREADPKPLAEQYLPNPYIYHKTKLLGIDEPSLNVFGKWPWYRDVHAQMLRSVEQYSPATVHFDIGFILPEKMPDSLGRELQKKNQSLIPVVRNAFDSIDQALIDELAKHNNVLVDLFVDRRSQNYSLSPRLLSRIQTTEYYATNYSQPVSAMTKKIFGTNIFFDKIEPVLAGIAANSQPVSVTIMPDSSDNVVRSFPLLNLYRSTDNKELGLFTIVLGLLMDFYRIDRDHIQIKPEKITLYSARVPRLDKYNVPQQKTVSFPKLKKLLTVDRQNTKYNKNLYNYLVNSFYLNPIEGDENKIPCFPLHILKTDNGYKLLDGLEVYDAAGKVGSGKINVITYREKDVIINTPYRQTGKPHTFWVNYAGREKQNYKKDDGSVSTYYPVKTESYYKAVTGVLPDLPVARADGYVDPRGFTAKTISWFKNYAIEKGMAFEQQLMSAVMGYSVLIIGENENVRSELQNGLTRTGFASIETTDVKAALPLIRKAYKSGANYRLIFISSKAAARDDFRLAREINKNYSEGTTLLVYKTPGDNRAASVSGESGSPLLIEQPGNINTFLPYLQGLVVKKYIFEDDPYSGRYYLFANFFNQVDNGVMGTVPDTINGYIKLYPRWLAMNGYPQKDFMMLNGKQILSVLQEPWGNGFLKYYNHFLFAGAFATGIGDIKQTPYGEMAGINVIINAFSTIVTENQLKKSGEVSLLNLGFMKVKLDILLLVLVGLLFGFLYGLTNIRINTYIFLGFLVATFLISLSLFLYNNFYLNIFPLVLINIFVFGSTIIYKLMTEEKDKKFIKATFANYLSQELIDNMIQNKQMPTLGGESRDMTPYFTDIQGFSTFSEKLTADQLVELLNEYLSAMTDILMAENGTLDKYEGDAIIAFFGAPVYSQRHPLEACYVGLNMQQKLLELREKWRNEKALPEEGERNKTKVPAEQWAPGAKWPKIVHDMKMRIGINTGEIVVGNMGSELRKNYTMMGDAVNLAARLEAGAKQYGVYTLVSEYTLNQEIKKEDGSVKKVIDFLEVRFIDKLTVVGRSEPLKVYELCARKGELSEQEKTLFKLFNEGMAFYKNMEWDKAIARFSESVKIERVPDGKTTPSEVFRKRCEQYKKEPPEGPEPGTPWDGVCRLTSK